MASRQDLPRYLPKLVANMPKLKWHCPELHDFICESASQANHITDGAAVDDANWDSAQVDGIRLRQRFHDKSEEQPLDE